MSHIRTSDIRESVIEGATDGLGSPIDSIAALALALIYVGDKIESTLTDIGPAIDKLAERGSVELGGVASSLGDIARELVR